MSDIINVVGNIITIISIFFYIYLIVMWVRGVAPVLYRIGNGLSHKKIVVFAKNDNLSSIESLLNDSRLFRKKNLYSITAENDLGKSEGKDIFLVYWPEWNDKIDQILNKMKDKTALVIYAPREGGSIPDDKMAEINKKRNVAISNFRGRLLNDIVTSIITISQSEK